jgi:STE24 endopeptidase
MRLGTLVVLAGVWAAAAYFLWDSTKVRGDLHLPKLSTHAFFSAAFLRHVEHFESFFYWLALGQIIVTVTLFALYAWRGHGFMRDSAAGPIGTGMLLAMLGFALAWLVTVPFDILSSWWERRYHQTHESYSSVIFGGWLGLGFKFVLLCVAVLIAMGFARLMPRLWWIPAAAVFIALQFLFAFVSPYLVPDVHQLSNERLRAAAHRIAEKEGVGSVPIREQRVDTKDPNAFSAGLGPSRRVVILSSMLDGRFTEPELEVTVAHEYGHQARQHILKGLGWYALVTIPLAWLIAVITRRRGGMRNPAAVPLAVLVYVVFNFVALPFQSAISRHMEAEADWMALQTTHDPQAMQSLMTKFSTVGLSNPNPPTGAYLVFYDHPTGMQRIAMARAWALRNHRALPGGS